MRFLISANNYPTSEYPLQSFIGIFSEELVRQGHDVTVVAPVSILSYLKHKIKIPPRKYCESVNTELGEKQIKIFRPRVILPGHGRLNKISAWLTQKIVNKCISKINYDFDVLYAHFWINAYNILNYAIKKDKPIFVATGEDKIIIDKFISSTTKKKLSDNIKGVICVSTKNKDESIKLSLTTSEKTIVIPNAVDTADFRPSEKEYARNILGFDKESFILAFCGRFVERKGVMRLSEAIQRCNDKNIKSIFIGRAIEGSKMNPNCDGILFKGLLPHKKIPLYLNAADVFVLPTLAEGCSNSIVEAMACGLPIISSDLQFNYDILDSNNAILINPNSIDEIKNAILKLKNNDELRSRMGYNSLEKAKELTINKRVKRITDFIELKIKQSDLYNR